MVRFIIAMIIAYLIGSISTSILLSKYLKLPDPRTQGSGSAGATNVLRTLGRKPALYVLLGDLLKGLIAVWIGRLFGLFSIELGLIALAVVVGHVYPVFFHFKGGRGVATSIGALLGLSFFAGILALIIWAAIAAIFRYSSLASLVTAIAMPILLLIMGNANFAGPMLLVTILIIWKHKDNIDRLLKKTEPKINF